MQIGSITIDGNLIVAPMAGVTDEPYRRICRDLGASLTVGEMAASDAHLRSTDMTMRRFRCDPDEPVPVVQILGADAQEMAQAARLAQDCGAKIVDINFGCPARVVCGKACGSALMREPEAAKRILEAVAQAATVPVTVKMRLGWDEKIKTAVEIARAAEDCGFAAVTVHGRTRAQRFSGTVDKEGIAEVVAALTIPVIANGDVAKPEDAFEMLRVTKAAGVMIGRGIYGNPWIFKRTKAMLETGIDPGEPTRCEAAETVLEHFDRHMAYWTGVLEEATATEAAVRSYRKHARWYMSRFARDEDPADVKALYTVVRSPDPVEVRAVLTEFFQRQ